MTGISTGAVLSFFRNFDLNIDGLSRTELLQGAISQYKIIIDKNMNPYCSYPNRSTLTLSIQSPLTTPINNYLPVPNSPNQLSNLSPLKPISSNGNDTLVISDNPLTL
jgi:hypothetical protein